jgi:hypothetical protein
MSDCGCLHSPRQEKREFFFFCSTGEKKTVFYALFENGHTQVQQKKVYFRVVFFLYVGLKSSQNTVTKSTPHPKKNNCLNTIITALSKTPTLQSTANILVRELRCLREWCCCCCKLPTYRLMVQQKRVEHFVSYRNTQREWFVCVSL